MIECSICCFSWDTNEMLSLDCCKNEVCNSCIDSLVVPICPYCRSVIPELRENKIYKQGYSYNDSLNDYTISQLLQHEETVRSMDDTHIESRILRRKIRRIRKLREREINTQRSKRQQEIRRHIQEELDFYLEM